MDSLIVLKFKGLPYISRYYQGSRYNAVRYKIKKAFSELGEVKKLFVSMSNNEGDVTLVLNDKILHIINTIEQSPIRMIRISWEQSIPNLENEDKHFIAHRAWLYNDTHKTFNEHQSQELDRINMAQIIDEQYYLNSKKEDEYEDEYEEWILGNQWVYEQFYKEDEFVEWVLGNRYLEELEK